MVPGPTDPGPTTDRPARDARTAGRPSRAEVAALLGVVALAAATRLPGLAARGQWDSDQGGQMLVLRAFVRDGAVPLVGPAASVGGFHHGALYYWLLAPAAALSGGNDPYPVLLEFALAGIAAVVVAWWAAREMAGPVAGLIAALLLTVSSASIAASTWLWNPNPVPLASLVAVGAAWRAWRRQSPRWWAVAAAAVALAGQLHVLAWVLALPIAGLYGLDLWRTVPGANGRRRRVLAWGGVGVAVVVLAYVPLLLYELGHDFAETRGVVAFLAAGGSQSTTPPGARVFVVAVRVLSWPLTGLLTAAPVPAVLAAVGIVAGLAWRAVRGQGGERAAARWLLASLAVACLVLGIGVGSLAEVTPLPVDQYHAAFDPVVVLAAALAIAGLAGAGRSDVKSGRTLGAVGTVGGPSREPRWSTHAGLAAAAVITLLIVAWNVTTWPPWVSPDGGWPAAAAAARRVEADVGGRPFALVSLPSFKPPDAYLYPLVRDGREPVQSSTAHAIVVLCDDLFVTDCTTATDSAARATLGTVRVVDRFSPAPGRHLAIYAGMGG